MPEGLGDEVFPNESLTLPGGQPPEQKQPLQAVQVLPDGSKSLLPPTSMSISRKAKRARKSSVDVDIKNRNCLEPEEAMTRSYTLKDVSEDNSLHTTNENPRPTGITKTRAGRATRVPAKFKD
eukprot:GHVP01047063.1.p2 GENE.GHVP01047063.1~~GHVP01047063.1.p2  ORF type:complete len:123 (+),score=19.49 GHVP01047063.1:454-822(+)